MTEPVEVPAGPLLLRPWRAGDAPAVLAALTDPVARVWSAPGRVAALGDARWWVTRRADGSGGEITAWAVVDAAGGELLGSVDLHSIDRVERVHAVEDPASGRVAEKAGSTFEGRLRRSYRYGDGVERDEPLWARLADDDVPDLSTRS
ncbi:GNAT family N-acetyltransferase [Geodermatophilus amargosae]|uniref:GNAT family N-acetyltransferase n=1 Tax=Geodermatophilus amargosae TaxID=1296565 RepID=UPI0034E04FF7